MIDKTISNYKLQSVIGSGGMGKVYLARQLTIDRKVAIKILDPSLSENPQFRERFINEANALAKLNHPNIVSIYDFVEFEGNYCIIMEYVKGATLDAMIDNNGKIDTPFATKIICQVLDGLSYAHKNSIIHRDIKPSNIIVDSDNRVKILDFGIAKIVLSNSNLTRTGTRMGSISYMSPEQILGKELDLKTDIYSAGITFYEILSGKLPYDTNTDSDFIVQNKIVNESLPDIRSINSSVNQNLAEAINIAIHKNPFERFENCDDFKAFMTGEKTTSSFLNINYNPTKSDNNQTKIANVNPSNDKTICIQKNNNVEKSNNKVSKEIKIAGVTLIIIVIIFGAIFLFNQENDNMDSDSQLQVKSKNDIIKQNFDDVVKEQEKKNSIEQKNNIEQINKSQKFIDDWITDTNNKNIDFQKYYSDKVNYYKAGKVGLSIIVKDKKDFFSKWDNIEINADQFTPKVISNDEIVVTFDKYFNVDNYSSSRNYNGKVKSRLVLKNIGGELKIISESDDLTYYTNKNF